jgi:hypothetical protein
VPQYAVSFRWQHRRQRRRSNTFIPSLSNSIRQISFAVGKFDPWPPQVWVDSPGIVFNAETNSGKFTVAIAANAPSDHI